MISITASTASEPISLEEAKAWLKATDAEDDLITALIGAARAHCERFTGLFLGGQTITQTMDIFPCDDTLTLLKGPVAAVSSVAIVNPEAEDGVVVFSAVNYIADPVGQRIVLKEGSSWPDVVLPVAGVRVTYTVSTDVPAPLLQGMKHLISHMYENRETADQIPPIVTALWSPYREVAI